MRRLYLVLLFATVEWVQPTKAQTAVTPDREYAKYVGKSQSIDAQADFGTQVNLRDGSFLVRVTDIELSGTGPLIRLTRTFRPKLATQLMETSGNNLGEWELEVPRIKTTVSTTIGVSRYSPTGWQVIGATSAQKNARCTRFSEPGRISFPRDPARGWNAMEWWDGYQLVDDFGDKQPIMVRTDMRIRPDYKLMTLNSWMVGCLPATTREWAEPRL